MSSDSGNSFKKSDSVLLITGAINGIQPSASAYLLSDPVERLAQYLHSIEFAIDHYQIIEKIVFCENTNYSHDYLPLIERAIKKGKELEVLIYEGNRLLIQKRGKGFGEGEIIEYALKNSALLRDCQIFYKLSGRLMIGNFDQVVATKSEDNGFLLHPKNIYLTKIDYIETFFFKVNKEFYNSKLLDAYKNVDESNFCYIEHLLYERLKKKQIRAFKYPLQIIGNSGTSGKPYLNSINALRLEKICCAIGAHNIQKNLIERILTYIFAAMIGLRSRLRNA